jgi:hypothetical protein
MRARLLRAITTAKHPDLHPTGTKDHLSVWDAKYFALSADFSERVLAIRRLVDGKPSGIELAIPLEGVLRLEYDAGEPIPMRPKKDGAA